MADGENSVQAWRPGAFSVAHLALGFGVLVSLTMAIFTLSL
jgi:hypothetical protein